MNKLLYITDQEEYSEHGAISSLFHGYLKQFLHVNVVYFTKYKHSFQIKEDDFVIPIQYDTDVIAYLQEQGIEIASYDYIFVRNIQSILKTVLHYRETYGYKVGFRASFAKSTQAYEMAKVDGTGLLKSMRVAYGNWTKNRLINQVDIFMPTSLQMQHIFYPNVTCKTYPLPNALDPKTLSVKPLRQDGIRRFVYVGSLDTLREFDVVLNAFEAIATLPWHLSLLVRSPEGMEELLARYAPLQQKITLLYEDERDAIAAHVRSCDVGLALLPDRDLYNNALSAKVLDYYSCALPALLSDTQSNRDVFDADEAFFCPFDTVLITQVLITLIQTGEEELLEVGKRGQLKLLESGRNYELMAENLFKEIARL